MKDLESTDIIKLAIKHYGPEHQKQKAIEEMGELITAIAREQDGRATPEQVITEIADVAIMIGQLSELYGRDAVAAEINGKCRRLLRRIEDDKND